MASGMGVAFNNNLPLLAKGPNRCTALVHPSDAARLGLSHGGRARIRADVRIIAATHRDLKQLVRQGLFREDLFYRLNVFEIALPALRDRREDIAPIVAELLRRRGFEQTRVAGPNLDEA